MSNRLSHIAAVAAAAATVGAAGTALANPKVSPFTYPVITMPRNAFEMENYVDIIPVHVVREDDTGIAEDIVRPRFQLQTELEYGVTDRIEAGFYFAFQQGAGADGAPLVFDGVKQRVRARFAEPGAWPVDVGVYLELAEKPDELEVEEKLLLQKRFDQLLVLVNLWGEHEYQLNEERFATLINPTVGVSYQLQPQITLGAEYWMRGELFAEDDPAAPSTTADGFHHYAGPTLNLQGGEAWISAGAYVRLDHLGDTPDIGDPYGRFWARVIVGIGI